MALKAPRFQRHPRSVVAPELADFEPRQQGVNHQASTSGEIRDDIKSTYDGPLVLATDYMVFNVTKSYIKTRMMVAAEDIWPPESGKEALERDEVAAFSGRGWRTDLENMAEWLVARSTSKTERPASPTATQAGSVVPGTARRRNSSHWG